MKCRHCGAPIDLLLVDLGAAPPSNAYLSEDALHGPEAWYPLRVLVCESCWLVQLEDSAEADELFNSEYAYFSGYSSTWLDHCRRYVAEAVERFALDHESNVIEVASNDGTLLLEFHDRNVGCIGIEPTSSTAAAARSAGLTVIEDFLTAELGGRLRSEGIQADLLVANNVLAHVPEIVDFVNGCALLLASDGVATFEFPHLVELIAEVQFDTVYHEHYSYFSLFAAEGVLASAGMCAFDVERIPTHGGSLRVFAQHKTTGSRRDCPGLREIRDLEAKLGVARPGYYSGFQQRVDQTINEFTRFLIDAKRRDELVVAYGAAAKGNTLLNYAGIRPTLVPFVVDRNPAKIGRFLPGSRIPIVDESEIARFKPDYVLLLPWNLREELSTQLAFIREWSGSFVIAIPEISVW